MEILIETSEVNPRSVQTISGSKQVSIAIFDYPAVKVMGQSLNDGSLRGRKCVWPFYRDDASRNARNRLCRPYRFFRPVRAIPTALYSLQSRHRNNALAVQRTRANRFLSTPLAAPFGTSRSPDTRPGICTVRAWERVAGRENYRIDWLRRQQGWHHCSIAAPRTVHVGVRRRVKALLTRERNNGPGFDGDSGIVALARLVG